MQRISRRGEGGCQKNPWLIVSAAARFAGRSAAWEREEGTVWDAQCKQQGQEIRRQADVYVLFLLAHKDKALRDYRDSKGRVPVFGANGAIGFNDSALCNHPSIVIGRKGAYRGVHFSPVPFIVIDTAFFMEAKQEFSWRWAYYEALRLDINNMDRGSAIPSTDRRQFYQSPICVPPNSGPAGI